VKPATAAMRAYRPTNRMKPWLMSFISTGGSAFEVKSPGTSEVAM